MTTGRCILIGVLIVVGLVGTTQASKLSIIAADAFVYTDEMKSSEQAAINNSNANLKLQQDQQEAQKQVLQLTHQTALIGKSFDESMRMRAKWVKDAHEFTDKQIAICFALAAQKPLLMAAEASQARSDCTKAALDQERDQIAALPEPK